MTLPAAPPGLTTIPTGYTHPFFNVVIFGGYKSGKSTFLSHFPKPLVAIDCGDGGISPFFHQSDPDVIVFSVTSPPEYSIAVDYCLKNQDTIASVVVDPLTELWTDTMEHWEDELGREDGLKGSDWRKIKGPWKIHLRRLKRATFHVGYAAWLKDTNYSEDRTHAGPGEKGTLSITPQAVPQLEKTVGYAVDMIFETATGLDSMNRPNGKHVVTFWGGRRPLSIPAEELHVGKKWTFDAAKPVNVWDTILAPLLPKWEENGKMVALGVSASQRTKEMKGLDQLASDAHLGEILRRMGEIKDPAGYREYFQTEIRVHMPSFPETAQATLQAAHDAKKEELGL